MWECTATFGGFYINKMLIYVYVNTIISTFFLTQCSGRGCVLLTGNYSAWRASVCHNAVTFIIHIYPHALYEDPYTDQHHPPSFLTKINAPPPPSPSATSALFAVEFWEIYPANAILLWRRTLLPPPTHQATLVAKKTGPSSTHISTQLIRSALMLSTFKNSPISPTQPLSILFCQMPPITLPRSYTLTHTVVRIRALCMLLIRK